MNTIQLTDEELVLVGNAMQAYLRAFGHDEADTVAEIKRVIAKVLAADRANDGPTSTG